jgi:hypothetical protein
MRPLMSDADEHYDTWHATYLTGTRPCPHCLLVFPHHHLDENEDATV